MEPVNAFLKLYLPIKNGFNSQYICGEIDRNSEFFHKFLNDSVFVNAVIIF